MAWTEITRRYYRREGLRYESDTSDAEWFVMEPLLPPASALGRPRATDMRAVIDAILYIASMVRRCRATFRRCTSNRLAGHRC
jgi:transposase